MAMNVILYGQKIEISFIGVFFVCFEYAIANYSCIAAFCLAYNYLNSITSVEIVPKLLNQFIVKNELRQLKHVVAQLLRNTTDSIGIVTNVSTSFIEIHQSQVTYRTNE